MPCTAPAGAGIDTSQARTLHALVLREVTARDRWRADPLEFGAA